MVQKKVTLDIANRMCRYMCKKLKYSSCTTTDGSSNIFNIFF